MGEVDIADQLRLQYRPDRWIRNRKWWMAIFMWGISSACTNAYVMYCRVYTIRRKQKLKMPKQMTHLNFLIEIALSLLDPEGSIHTPMSIELGNSSVLSGIVSEGSLTRAYSRREQENMRQIRYANEQEVLKTKVTTLTANNLRTKFPHRFNGKFHAIINVPSTDPKPCQWCSFKERQVDKQVGQSRAFRFNRRTGKKQYRTKRCKRNYKQVFRCVICNVDLCCNCYNDFHQVVVPVNR